MAPSSVGLVDGRWRRPLRVLADPWPSLVGHVDRSNPDRFETAPIPWDATASIDGPEQKMTDTAGGAGRPQAPTPPFQPRSVERGRDRVPSAPDAATAGAGIDLPLVAGIRNRPMTTPRPASSHDGGQRPPHPGWADQSTFDRTTTPGSPTPAGIGSSTVAPSVGSTGSHVGAGIPGGGSVDRTDRRSAPTRPGPTPPSTSGHTTSRAVAAAEKPTTATSGSSWPGRHHADHPAMLPPGSERIREGAGPDLAVPSTPTPDPDLGDAGPRRPTPPDALASAPSLPPRSRTKVTADPVATAERSTHERRTPLADLVDRWHRVDHPTTRAEAPTAASAEPTSTNLAAPAMSSSTATTEAMTVERLEEMLDEVVRRQAERHGIDWGLR